MWAFAIKQKMTAALLLCAVLCLVMLTNLRERRNAARISTAVTSIYEDRLVVGLYILKLTKHVEGILTVLDKDGINTGALINEHIRHIDELNLLYGKTKLTETEKSNFENFKQLSQTISVNNKTEDYNAAKIAAVKAEGVLQTLSSIQVEEGKNQLDKVLSMTNLSSIISYIEMAILIVIAVIIQVLVLSSKTLMSAQKPTNENLN